MTRPASKARNAMKLGVEIKRDLVGESFKFTELFGGFERVAAVKKLFGRGSLRVLRETTVHIVHKEGYLRVDNDNGDILVCEPYLRTADERHLYLDVIHELVHVRQHMAGRELYDRTYSYVDRPTEVEAYSVAVAEARRIGMSDTEIADYLRVEWVSGVDFRRMLSTLGVSSY